MSTFADDDGSVRKDEERKSGFEPHIEKGDARLLKGFA
jgi:hypothetical protein